MDMMVVNTKSEGYIKSTEQRVYVSSGYYGSLVFRSEF